jgi:hypothetical protein
MSRSLHKCTRVIVDECVSSQSELFVRFGQECGSEGAMNYLFLAKEHRAVPDDIILTQLLGPDSVLLTMDRVLHNRACRLGLRSYTLDETGAVVCNPLRGLPIEEAPRVRPDVVPKSDYAHPANRIATACKAGLTEKDFQRYRTRRRRIRSYFGSEENLARVALTIGSERHTRGQISGFFLAIAGNHGKKGLRASEGYTLCTATEHTTAGCLLSALREIYLLQIELVPLDLYVIPEASHRLALSLLSDSNLYPESSVHRALRTCLSGVAAATVHPCVKGPFYDAMKSKLKQVVNPRSNEVVTMDYRLLVETINRLPPGEG